MRVCVCVCVRGQVMYPPGRKTEFVGTNKDDRNGERVRERERAVPVMDTDTCLFFHDTFSYQRYASTLEEYTRSVW